MMNINSGSLKGRKIIYDKKLNVRPTTSKSKEGVFNTLNNLYVWSKIRVLDLFSGSGNISYEFASRGVKEITAVDHQINALQFIQKQSSHWGMNINTKKKNALSFLEITDDKYDVIFADPPYDFKRIDEIHDIIFKRKLLRDHGLFVLEHAKNKNFTNSFNFMEKRTYSSVNFSFFGA